MKQLFNFTCLVNNALNKSFDWASSLFMLANRIYLARVFLWSGWLKLSSWTTTVYMFANDFKTGPLSAETAAILGTTLEIVFPLFILLGFATRLSAVVLFLFNIISVWAYPLLLTPEYSCALKDHLFWGVLILLPIFYGPGIFSIDHIIKKKICPEYHY